MERFEERVLDKLDEIGRDLTEIKVRQAEMPAMYVTRAEATDWYNQMKQGKRAAITIGVGMCGVLVPILLRLFV